MPKGKNEQNQDIRKLFLVGGCIGGLCFLLIYGVHVLDVTYDDWLWAKHGDLTQHYMGWLYYRDTPWQMPLGLVEGLLSQKISIMYTDSIPIFAFLFKILSPFLPENFQYFGLWGFFCFFMQGGFAFILVKRASNNRIINVLAVIMYCCSAVILQRMFAHTALAANWIILASFSLCLYREHLLTIKRKLLSWGTLFAAVLGIHMYYFPMVLCVLFYFLLYDCIITKRIREQIYIFVFILAESISILWIIGAFYGGVSASEGGYGAYSANINTLFNSQGSSLFLDSLPFFEGQHEGYAYLGLGVISMLMIGGVAFLYRLFKHQLVFEISRLQIVIGMLCFGTFFIFAVSTRVTINQNVILDIQVPSSMHSLLSVFRASGRFIWPVMYAFFLLADYLVVRCISSRYAVFIVFICCIIQIMDLSNIIRTKHTEFTNKVVYEGLNSDAWDYLAKDAHRLEYITFQDEGEYTEASLLDFWSLEEIFSLSEYAYSNGMELNDFYAGRRNEEKLAKEKLDALMNILRGDIAPSTIYVFTRLPIDEERFSLNFYSLNGFIIGTEKEIPEEYLDGSSSYLLEKQQGYVSIMPRREMYMRNGEFDNTSRILHAEGVSYGPRMTLEAGNYRVRIVGENLEYGNYDIAIKYGESIIETYDMKVSYNEVVYNFTLENKTDLVETRVFNIETDEVIRIQDILLMKVE